MFLFFLFVFTTYLQETRSSEDFITALRQGIELHPGTGVPSPPLPQGPPRFNCDLLETHLCWETSVKDGALKLVGSTFLHTFSPKTAENFLKVLESSEHIIPDFVSRPYEKSSLLGTLKEALDICKTNCSPDNCLSLLQNLLHYFQVREKQKQCEVETEAAQQTFIKSHSFEDAYKYLYYSLARRTLSSTHPFGKQNCNRFCHIKEIDINLWKFFNAIPHPAPLNPLPFSFTQEQQKNIIQLACELLREKQKQREVEAKAAQQAFIQSHSFEDAYKYLYYSLVRRTLSFTHPFGKQNCKNGCILEEIDKILLAFDKAIPQPDPLNPLLFAFTQEQQKNIIQLAEEQLKLLGMAQA
jgi:hypothetical protein